MTDPAAAPAPCRVLLVDPDDRVRESLAGLLRIGQRCLVIGTAGTADGAVLLARLRAVAPETRVLVLNWSETADLTTGADAYARKTFRPHELIDAVVSTTRRTHA